MEEGCVKRLYTRVVRWLRVRWNFEVHRSDGYAVLHADGVRGIDPASGRVIWRISKDGAIEITGAAAQPSEDRSDRQVEL